jgi:hypothetical protein
VQASEIESTSLLDKAERRTNRPSPLICKDSLVNGLFVSEVEQ